jgi:hypothetical protein
MNDTAPSPPADPAPPPPADLPGIDAPGADTVLQRNLTELEHRVQMLESMVAALREAKAQDAQQLEERITERVAQRLPLPAAAPDLVDPTRPPSLRDIALPLPNASTVAGVVQSSWVLMELASDAKNMVLMLLDRRYHRAWLARLLVALLIGAVLTSDLWCPLYMLRFIGGYLDKLFNVALALVVFLHVAYEARRYKQWRAGRA